MKFLRPPRAFQSKEVDPTYAVEALKCVQAPHGHPLYMVGERARAMILTGFSRRDSVATNALLYALYLNCTDYPLRPIRNAIVVPMVNPHAYLSEPSYLDDEDINVYFDTLTLRSRHSERWHTVYHRLKPDIVVVIRGGERLRIYATDQLIADELGASTFRPSSPLTPHEHVALEYSHAVYIETPNDPEIIPEIIDVVSRAIAVEAPRTGTQHRQVELDVAAEKVAFLEKHGIIVERQGGRTALRGDTALIDVLPRYLAGV